MDVWQRFAEFRRQISKYEKFDVKDTVKYAWQTKPRVNSYYVLYRWAQFVLHSVIALSSFLDVLQKSKGSQHSSVSARGALFYVKWFLYVTSWSMFANVVQSLMGAVGVTLAFCRIPADGTPTTVYGVPKVLLNVYCLAFMVSLNLSVFTFAEISILLQGRRVVKYDPLDATLMCQLGAGSLLSLVDLFIVKFTYKMITGLYSLLALMAYFLLTWFHHTTRSYGRNQTQPYIYKRLDWSKPWEAVVLVFYSAFLLEVINAGILWWMCQLRRSLTNVVERITVASSSTVRDPSQQSYYQTREGTPMVTSPKKTRKQVKIVPTQKVLNDEINRATANLESLQRQLAQSPKDAALIEAVANAKKELKEKIRERDELYPQNGTQSKNKDK